MEIFNVQIAGLLLIGLAVVLVGLWSARHGAARVVMLCALAGMVGLTFGGSANLLGRAKPVAFEWLSPQVDEATVISGYLIEEQGIFLTLIWDGAEPHLYVLPWDTRKAEQLQKALSDAEVNGTEAKMRSPFQAATAGEEATFYASPQEALPEKQAPSAGIQLG